MEKQIHSKSHLKSFINLVFSSFSQHLFTWLLLCLSRRQQHACTQLIHYRFSTWFFLYFEPLFALFSMRNCLVVTCLIFGSTWSYNSQFFAHFSVKNNINIPGLFLQWRWQCWTITKKRTRKILSDIE